MPPAHYGAVLLLLLIVGLLGAEPIEWIIVVEMPASAVVADTISDPQLSITTPLASYTEVVVTTAPPPQQNTTGTCVLQGCVLGVGPDCSCIPGFYYSTNNNQTCTACPAGFFKQGYGKESACTACAAGASTMGLQGQSGCWDCLSGTNTDGRPGQADCAPCPNHTFAGAGGVCLCEMGTVRDASGGRCAPCPIGYYYYSSNQNNEQGSCLRCPWYASTASEGATACTVCLAGAAWSPPQCVLCEPGSFRANTSANVTQGCSACAAGFFSAERGASQCAGCAPGFFAAYAGASACEACPANQTTAGGGATGCVCAPGFPVWQKATRTCEGCGAGTYLAGGTTRCDECAPGTFAGSYGQTACSACAVGFFSALSGASACQSCPPYSNSSSATNMTRCTCIAGSNLDAAGAQCAPCAPGQYQPLVGCSPCPAGTYSPAPGAVLCAACGINQYAPSSGASGCLACPDGLHTLAAGSAECICPVGMFGPPPLNTTSRFSDCQPCRTECANGTFVVAACTAHADLQCAACSLACALPAYYVVQECSPLITTTVGGGDIKCKRCSSGCLAGYYLSSACARSKDIGCTRCATACPVGHIMTSPCTISRNMECAPCPPGTFALNGACERCADGFVAPSAASTSCGSCPDMAYAEQCVAACPAGAYPGTERACYACPPLTYGADGLGCTSCVGGNVWSAGAVACLT